MEDYLISSDFASVIETDRAVFINGMHIPHVLLDGVKCDDTRNMMHEVTITFLTDSFIRLAGKPGRELEETLGIKDKYKYELK